MRVGRGRLILAVGSIVLATASIEIGLRWRSPQTMISPMLEPDPDLGFRPRPGAAGIIEKGEFRITFQIDREGWRTGASTEPIDAQAPNLICLGDSYTFGYGVEADQTYCARLAGRLRDGGWKLRPILAACPGWGTLHVAKAIERGLIPEHVELAILAFFVNDLADNRSLSALLAGERPPPLWATLAKTVSAVSAYGWLVTHSHLAARLRSALFPVSGQRGFVPGRIAGGSLEEDLRREEALLAEVARAIERRGGKLRILLIPSREALLGRAPQADTLLTRVAAIAAGLGIPALNLTSLLRPDVYFAKDGHWTPEGHEVVAAATAEWLRSLAADAPSG